jgi:antitoxin (DNA-binding transcriptional repressor) of toxin-antitoxin stability system
MKRTRNDRNNEAHAEEMRAIEALDAEADFDRILDEVENGETVLIMRNGIVVARIVPISAAEEVTERGVDQKPLG